MSRFVAHVCFDPGGISAVDVLRLVLKHDVGFEPETITSSKNRRRVRYSPSEVERFIRAGDTAWVRVEGQSGRFGLGGIGSWPTRQIVWSTRVFPSVDLIEEAVTMPGFNAALVGDADDVNWQSTESINAYEIENRSHEGLPKAWDETFNRDKIDISGNQGRRVAVPGMWLWAAAQMWFGSGAFRVLDRDRLLGFPDAVVEERPDGVVRLDLYSLDSPIEEIRGRQRAFREWMGYDEIEERIPELRQLVASDPEVELDLGEFEHGGVRRLIEWLDADEQPVRRSVASKQRITELGHDGMSVWSTVEEVNLG